MAFNWDAYLTNESFKIPNDEWADLLAPAVAPPTSQMPKSTTTDTSGSSPEDVNNFDSLLDPPSADPYFDDSLFLSNDYFLGDLDVLKPFGNNFAAQSSTEQSPEPALDIDNDSTSQTFQASMNELNRLTQLSPAQRQALQRANSFPNPAYESMFPNNLDSGFVEDLTFPNGPKGASNTAKPSVERAQTSQAIKTTSKRTKNRPDILSACWTSPLCPNHDVNGPPPNPSTCGGGCAPFLFADQDALPSITNLLAEPQEVTAEDGIVKIQSRSKKRSESDASANGFSTRQFERQQASTPPTEEQPRHKSETAEETSAKDSPEAPDDGKPKSRRRLPHNQVERKYRESLNTQLESLKRVVPSLQQNRGCDGADIEDLPTPSKPSKAVILASATAYIKQMEKDRKGLAEENEMLRMRVKALQSLVKCDDCSLMQYVMDLKIKQGG
ncbi:transcription factor bhlh [Pyrenophora seminiperda CCB06]|uniref:Transcription factor bhlh n=1 Tax=Pyrenophora seminiperda CCB06 TaxID=1302712 RepID=A0A3M7LYL1_9PLEO|nr:transcription factor bhlh [Pyrenophora seminiperda CCB06]